MWKEIEKLDYIYMTATINDKHWFIDVDISHPGVIILDYLGLAVLSLKRKIGSSYFRHVFFW